MDYLSLFIVDELMYIKILNNTFYDSVVNFNVLDFNICYFV